jgi:23S rRNA-/tRNA-specific pseudouridylate synthase
MGFDMKSEVPNFLDKLLRIFYGLIVFSLHNQVTVHILNSWRSKKINKKYIFIYKTIIIFKIITKEHLIHKNNKINATA